MNIKNKQSYWEYLIVLIILVGQYCILKYLGPRDSGIFSWPRIILPNMWVLLTALAWLKFKPLGNFNLSYQYYPKFLKWIAFLLSSSLIIQLLFFQMTIRETSPVDIYKFIFLSAIVPFSEELFYRGLLFHTLLRDGRNWYLSAALVSFTFAFIHLSQGLIAFITLLLFSGILCYLAYLSKGIISGLLVHICWNALYYNKLLTSTPQRWIFNIIIIICIFFIAWKSLKISKQDRIEEYL